MRTWPPGGTLVAKWPQNSGGWVRNSQRASAPRGLKTRSLARVLCSSRRMQAMIPVNPWRDGVLEAGRLPAGRAGVGRERRVHRLDGGAGGRDQVQPPLPGHPIAEGVDLGELEAGVHVNHRERHAPEEGLAGQLDPRVGVLAHGPEHAQPVHGGEGLAQDGDALALQSVQVIPVEGHVSPCAAAVEVYIRTRPAGQGNCRSPGGAGGLDAGVSPPCRAQAAGYARCLLEEGSKRGG